MQEAKKRKPFVFLVGLTIVIIVFATVLFSGSFKVYADDEYNDNLREQLLLDLPEVTENPNYAVTFTDPTEKGVTLGIDGKTAIKITSPYNLPTLGIGEHDLVFKFYDKEEVSQILEDKIVIIPRAPTIEIPKISKKSLELNGTGVAGGIVELLVTDGIDSWRAEAQINTSGKWTHTIEYAFTAGRYSVIAIARKSGYASKYSEKAVGELVNDNNKIKPKESENKKSFTNLEWSEIPKLVQESIVVDIILVSTLLFGVISGYFFRLLGSSEDGRKAKNILQSMLEQSTDMNGKTQDNDGQDKKVSVKDVLENGEKSNKNDKKNDQSTKEKAKIDGKKKSENKKKDKDTKKKQNNNISPKASKGIKGKKDEKGEGNKDKKSSKQGKVEITPQAINKPDQKLDHFDDFKPKVGEKSTSITEEPKEKTDKDENILTRWGFLKKFKSADPDNKDEKEK